MVARTATTQRRTRPKRTNGKRVTMNESELQAFGSDIAIRATLASALGQSYGGDRDLYTALGYKKPNQIKFADYVSRYYRGDIAKAIVDKPVRACWRKPPTLVESESDETDLEKDYAELVDRLALNDYFSRLDRMARIGTYAVLLMGFDDGENFSEEVRSAQRLLYVMPYNQDSAKIDIYDTDSQSERYGQPLIYSVKMKRGNSSQTHKVHWSRVIHVCEDPLEGDVEGTPCLRAVLNRLEDLDRILGAAAEGYWRGALPGWALSRIPGFTDTQDKTELEEKMVKWLHGYERWMALGGYEIKALTPQVSDPSKHVSVALDMVAATANIPKRVLLGSERGELASSMDEQNWRETVEARQLHHCEARITRPFVNRNIAIGTLAKPAESYDFHWPSLYEESDQDRAKVGETMARMLKSYVDAMGAEDILPPEMLLRMAGVTDAQLAKIEEIVKQRMGESGDEEAEEEAEVA